MADSHARDILVFAGQGSKQHLGNAGRAPDSLREQLGQDQELAAIFSSFLDRARDVVRDEYSSNKADWSLGPAEEEEAFFEQSNNLLVPPPSLQLHPVFQTISLYTRHILALILYQSQRKTHHVVETTGVCTGVLPAILAAAFSSYASDAFVSAAVQGARLAFWIGVRAASMYTEETPDDAPDKNTCSCVLSVFGVSEEKMGELLKGYYTAENEVRVQNQ
jgi:hypothetical protein